LNRFNYSVIANMRVVKLIECEFDDNNQIHTPSFTTNILAVHGSYHKLHRN